MTLRSLACTLALLLLVSVDSSAVDHPISGARLTVKRHASGAHKIVFVSRDPNIVLPAIGGDDDPRTEGAVFQMHFANGNVWGPVIGADVGVPGWSANVDPPSFRYVHRVAGAPSAPVGSVRVRNDATGSLLRVVLPWSNHFFAAPVGPVGVELRLGSIRMCVRFDASTIRRDQDGRFVAADATAGSVADCTHPTLSGLTLCGDATAPACGGHCESGLECVPDGASGCHCQPPPPPPCSDAFLCEEGACPDGSTCNYDGGWGGSCFCQSDATPCGDTAPACNGACPAGLECELTGASPMGCACLPAGSVGCGRSEQCGGDCPDGQTCDRRFHHSGSSWCQCGISAPCGAGGTECPPGKSCLQVPYGYYGPFVTHVCWPLG